jgi:hypothetical protein
VFTRVADGRARVVREVRAAAPLMAALRAPVPSRGPWLTAVLNTGRWRSLPVPAGRRPVAVVVEPHRQGRPAALACLELRRAGPATTVTLLGQDTAPLPPGRPALRLLAADHAAAELLAAGILDLLGSLRGPWSLRFAGLPMGDPTLRALAAAVPAAVLANERSHQLVDDLDPQSSPPVRSRDPRVVERWLPAVLAREPDAAARGFLRATARLHAAIGQLELAVVADGDRPRAALLTLLDGGDRWPWWGFSDLGGLGTAMGAPLVGFTARGSTWPGWARPGAAGRLGARVRRTPGRLVSGRG